MLRGENNFKIKQIVFELHDILFANHDNLFFNKNTQKQMIFSV